MKTKRFLLILFFNIITVFIYAENKPMYLKNNDVQLINAAIEHPDGSAYFFVGKYFHQYDTKAGKLKRTGLIGKDAWYGLPADVDAAVVHPQNKKGYIFKGNMYYRYDFSKKKVDKKGILNVDGWKGLVGPFDAAIMHPTNNSAYFFKGSKYYRYNFSKKKMDKVGTIGVDSWKGMPVNLDAAVMHSNGKAYGFTDDHYHRYVFGKKVDKKGVIGKDGWKLFHQLDAVVYNNFDNNPKTIDSHYIRGQYGYYEANVTGGYIGNFNSENVISKKRFGQDWYKGTPPNIDAGLYHPIKNKYYFFKEEKYYRYDPKTKKIDKTGVIGKDGWPGIPINLDAAYYDPDTNEAFFFRGSKVFLFDVKANKGMFYGEIAARFKGVPNYIDAAFHKGDHVFFIKKTKAYLTMNGQKGRKYNIQSGFFK